VQVRYPGAWVAPGVWATHGHYLDSHLIPNSAYGMLRGLLGTPPAQRAAPGAYELGRRPSLSRVSRWLPRTLATLVDDLAELVRAASMPRRRMLHRGIAPLTSALLGLQMQHASIPAVLRVVSRLGVNADAVVFGHVHRLGPLTEDDPQQWTAQNGRPAILNCGSWVYEPLLVHRATPPHPYWPGGAVLINDGEAPRAIGLLDDLPPAQLR
jgi:hypothetical protein